MFHIQSSGPGTLSNRLACILFSSTLNCKSAHTCTFCCDLQYLQYTVHNYYNKNNASCHYTIVYYCNYCFTQFLDTATNLRRCEYEADIGVIRFDDEIFSSLPYSLWLRHIGTPSLWHANHTALDHSVTVPYNRIDLSRTYASITCSISVCYLDVYEESLKRSELVVNGEMIVCNISACYLDVYEESLKRSEWVVEGEMIVCNISVCYLDVYEEPLKRSEWVVDGEMIV